METSESKYITVTYKMYSIENGEREFEEEAPADSPFQFITDLGMALDFFEEQVKNLNKGDKFDFTVPKEEAHGDYDDDHIIELPKSIFLIEGKFDSQRFAEGAIVPLRSAEGHHINGSVVEVKEEVVIVDINHPYAGCDLNFVGEVLESRPPTSEELSSVLNMMSGGGGCSCGSCGDGCDDGCDDHKQGCGGCR